MARQPETAETFNAAKVWDNAGVMKGGGEDKPKNWFAGFQKGDHALGKFVRIQKEPFGRDDKMREFVFATAVDGSPFRFFLPLECKDAFKNMAPGTVFIINTVDMVKAGRGGKHWPRYAVRSLPSFPEGTPVPPFDLIRAAVEADKAMRDDEPPPFDYDYDY